MFSPVSDDKLLLLLKLQLFEEVTRMFGSTSFSYVLLVNALALRFRISCFSRSTHDFTGLHHKQVLVEHMADRLRAYIRDARGGEAQRTPTAASPQQPKKIS
jgi:hypothetical protein